MSKAEYGYTGRQDLSVSTFYGAQYGFSRAPSGVSATFLSQSAPAANHESIERYHAMLKANEEWADTIEPSCQLNLK